MDDRRIGVLFAERATAFSLRHRVQTGSGAHTFFPMGKAAELEAEHSSPTAAVGRKACSCT
jgi:hypothetical protein